jgi:hypothetical protein
MGTEEGEKVEAKGIENIFNEISRKLLWTWERQSHPGIETFRTQNRQDKKKYS